MGAALVDASRSAFTVGFAAAGYLGAAIIACIVAIALLVVPPEYGHPGDPEPATAGDKDPASAPTDRHAP
ncbi:hypothetical protein [Nocardia neocaledoniensis]|uniref:hypothetical protein n=1 Tax=Nocardia neocaledoniensis TaxID=236511 RepID=UPI002454F7A9|nr:hypothetical protein [Nocardia neocaledoniensis]